MRFFRSQIAAAAFAISLALGFIALTHQPSAYSQETTGGIQGTVKDPSGAVVAKARVTITSPSLLGSKEVVTDASGYYRFANLPPGTYAIVVKAEGFETTKREGLAIQVGHLPTVDIALRVGATATTVEVTGAAPVIDTTTTQNITNVTAQALQNLPTGVTFQSVIQFAPMAREEPLSGMSENGSATGGSGGSMPGSSGNGLGFGYMIGGAADSESSYLVDGQDTENISGGYSKANVPMDFIQEVDMKTSGISAEYGGALGGVVNAVTKSGGNEFHGEVFSYYDSSGTDANTVNAYLRYDPTAVGNGIIDPPWQIYSAQKDHFRNIQPGVLVTGPIVKDRLWFTGGFEPLYNSRGRSVNFTPVDPSTGEQYFTQDRQQYFGLGRLDAALTKKIRVYFKWLPEYARETGSSLPNADPIASESTYLNTGILSPLSQYYHGIGWSAPIATYNAGADITLTQNLVATTRYGYFFDNYHDFGWPTTTPDLSWSTSGSTDVNGNAFPAGSQLTQDSGYSTTAYNSSYALYNADKHYQFDQDFALYHGGWWGTHNFKFGYQLNHLVNVIDQNGNVPYAFLTLGPGTSHSALTATGAANCNLLSNEWGACTGQYGVLTVQDFSTILKSSTGAPTPASDWNHALYVQDSWNVGKGLTFDLGLRIEKETLPAPGGVKVSSISFPWSDKIEPRLGAAWDPTRKGKMKIFGSYGVVNDVMKLLLAQTSWGAQAYEQCSYALGPDGTSTGFSTTDIDITFVNGRACPNGPATTQANFASGQVPTSLTDAGTGVSLIENVNLRPWEPVAPNVKPYRQHEYVIGWDYEFTPNIAFHVRYDRRRLDHAIEDASLSDVNWGETYAVVNPGEGVDSTINGYASYLGSLGQAFGVPGWEFDTAAFGTCAGCPANPKPIRNYDGMELRLTLANTAHVTGEVSYTYSSLWGNYPGLTTTDQTDGGITGRNSPDTTRSFDEPFYYFGANGKSTDGPLPTDRPNVFKGDVYYTIPWWKHQTTTFGIFQQFLQGSPMSSWIDLGGAIAGEPYEATYVFGRGQWTNMTVDPNTGGVTVGTPYARRTPWFIQSDLNASHTIRTGDHESISFEATALNAFNQHAVTAYWGGMDSLYYATALYPGNAGLYSGAAFYQEVESGYNVQQFLNTNGGGNPNVIGSGQYGQPYLFQLGRQVRFALRYTF
jgi:outer membrane receptor protein involved in Fe transport